MSTQPNPVVDKPAEQKQEERKPFAEFKTQRAAETRKSRGGLQERIDTLTKRSTEATEAAKASEAAAAKAAEEAAAARKAAETKAAEPPPKAKEEPKQEQPKVEVKPEEYQAQIKIDDKETKTLKEVLDDKDKFPDNTKYTTTDGKEVTLGDLRKVQPKEPTEAETKAKQEEAKRIEEATTVIKQFNERATQFVAKHPDFQESLKSATDRGLSLSDEARNSILVLDNGPEVVYWLSRPENEETAKAVGAMKGPRAAAEIGRISARLESKANSFLSLAPIPGTRLTGSQTAAEIANTGQKPDFHDYARQRRAQKRGEL